MRVVVSVSPMSAMLVTVEKVPETVRNGMYGLCRRQTVNNQLRAKDGRYGDSASECESGEGGEGVQGEGGRREGGEMACFGVDPNGLLMLSKGPKS